MGPRNFGNFPKIGDRQLKLGFSLIFSDSPVCGGLWRREVLLSDSEASVCVDVKVIEQQQQIWRVSCSGQVVE